MTMKNGMTRRDFLRTSAISSAGLLAAACSLPGPVMPQQTPQEVAAVTPKGPVNVSYMYSNWRDAVHTGDTPIFKAWADPVGCRIEPLLQLKEEYDTRVLTRISSGEIADLTEVMDKSIIDQYGPRGVFAGVDVSYVESNLPNIKRLWEKYPTMKAVMVSEDDGKIYTFPYLSPASALSPWAVHALSDEYMQLIGMDYRSIRTLDDYTEMFRALKDLGPDGPDFGYAPQWTFSEESDISQPTQSALAVWGQCFRTAHRPFFSYDEEEYVFGPLMPEYQAMVEYLRMLVEEGHFFPEWYNMGTNKKKYIELAHQLPRRIGVSSPTLSEMASHGQRAQFWPLRAPIVDGKPGYYINQNAVLTTLKTWGISAASENRDKILELVDFGYSDQGGVAFEMGLEGETFERSHPPMDRVIRDDFSAWEDGWWGYMSADFGSWKWQNEPKWERWEAGVNSGVGIMRPEVVGAYVAHRYPMLGGGFRDADGNVMPMGEWAQPPEGWAQISGPLMIPDDANSLFDWSSYHTAAFFQNEAPDSLKPAAPILTFTPEELQELQKSLLPLNTFVDETTLAFIQGNKPMTGWDSFLQDMEKFKPQEIIAVFNDSLQRFNAKLG